MKTCSKCKLDLSESSFTRNRSKIDGLNHSCRTCHNVYTRKHYKANKSYYVKKAKKNEKLIASEIRKLKQRPCVDCTKVYPYYVMDFDHVRGQKKFNLSTGRRYGRLIALEEAKKCDVVCANCHRLRTFRRGLQQ